MFYKSSLQFTILKKDNNINFSEKFQNDPKDIDLRNYKFISESINKYDQVFSSKHGYIDGLSIIDLIFNLGPETIDYLNQVDRKKIRKKSSSSKLSKKL